MWRSNSVSGEWWVHCDTCGQVGPPKPTLPEAGEAWNVANTPVINIGD